MGCHSEPSSDRETSEEPVFFSFVELGAEKQVPRPFAELQSSE